MCVAFGNISIKLKSLQIIYTNWLHQQFSTSVNCRSMATFRVRHMYFVGIMCTLWVRVWVYGTCTLLFVNKCYWTIFSAAAFWGNWNVLWWMSKNYIHIKKCSSNSETDYFVLYNEYVACEEDVQIYVLFICLVFMDSYFCHLAIYGTKTKIKRITLNDVSEANKAPHAWQKNWAGFC